MRKILSALFFVFLFILAPNANAQGPAQGSPIYGSFDGGGLAQVNLQNLNVTAKFPIAGSQGRGLSPSFLISYNSSIWSNVTGGWNPIFDHGSIPSWGWNELNVVGRVNFQMSHAHCPGDPVGLNLGTTYYSNFSFIAPDGTKHAFTIAYHVPGECGGTAGGTYTGFATDGSGFYIDANQTMVRDRSGLTVSGYGAGLKDTNGNFYSSTSSYNSGNGQTTTTWTDSRGKTALLVISPNPTNTQSDTYSYYDSSGILQSAYVYHQTLNIATNFGCSGTVEYTGTATLPTSIQLTNGQSYGITYEPTPNVSGKYTGRIQKITLPSGGYVQFTYGTTNDGINCSDGSAVNLTVTRSDGTTTTTTQYVRAQVAGVWQTTVTYPQLPYDSAANQVVVAFDSNGHEASRKIYQGSATGNPLRTVTTSWTTSSPITPASQTTVFEDQSTAASTDTSYDSYGNLLSVSEHDWGTVSSPGPILRTTTLTYLSSTPYTNLNILNRVSRKTVADGGGTVHYREDSAYDQTALNPCPIGVAQHDDTNFACTSLTRGNLTSVTTYQNAAAASGPITKNFHYDIFGNLVQADLNCCQTKTWTYSATTQYAFPDSISRGSSPGTQLTTSATYNASNGSVATATDENGKITSYTYDLLGRTKTVTRPDSTVVTYSYDDAHNAVSVSTPIQGTNALQQKSVYDGLGRTIKTTALDASNNSYSISEAQYDVLSRAYKVSNPHNSTAQYWTETRFDALGRPTVVIPTDGTATSNNAKYTYATNTVTITDPAGKAIKRQVDGLGRAVKTFEPDPSNGNALTLETDLTYSTVDSLQTVAQGSQTRNYTYDDLGRLLTAKIPETNQVATSYVYSDFDLVAQRTDPRGVITTYSYDNLNRLSQVSYNVGTTGVPATSTVSYTYDEGGAAAFALGRLTTLTDGTGTEKYVYNQLGQATQVTKTISGTPYVLGYSYNLAGKLSTVTYPSGRVVQESYDVIGRLCAVGASGATCTSGTNYASGFGYSPAGQITGFNYGNGVSAAFTYSSDRLQLQSLSYVKGSQTLSSLNYWYKTDSTNCPSAPAGNNGQIQCIQDNVDTGRSTTYAYDALYRLSTAVTTGSAAYPKWGLQESYDRYGNRWSQTAISGCVSPMGCPQPTVSVDATTNRINSGGYGYDANGNMTNDGVNTLVYDAENRSVSSNGSQGSGTYTYDGNGLRVKKVSGGTTTVYLFSGSKVVAEYDNGATVGSPSREYIYAEGSLLAKFESGGTTYYHPDHLSTRVLSDASGNILGQRGNFPFGENWYESGTTTKLKFTSYERDSESGNDFAMARYYVNRLARFSALDPFTGSASTPQSLNRYSYVQNDPVNATDLSGMMTGGFWGMLGEFNVMDTPVRIGTMYHFTGTLNYQNYNLGQLIGFADHNEIGMSTEGIYGFPIISGPSGASSGNSGDKPWEFRSNVVALLRAKNDCSNWFNKGTGSAADVMSHVPILLYDPKEVSYNMPDANTGDNPQTPIYVNSLGRFYTARYNSNSVGDVYAAGSLGARMTILLHELAHKVQPPGFIPHDADIPGGSEKNTQAVIEHCAKAIDAQKP